MNNSKPISGTTEPRTVLQALAAAIRPIVLLLVLILSALPGTASAYEAVKPEEVDAGMPYNVKQVPVKDPQALAGVRIALVAAHGFEEVEGTFPLEFLAARGASVDVITPDWIKDRVMAVRFLKPSVWIPVTKTISQADATNYAAVLIPGGAWNPIIMRTDGAILDFVKKAHRSGALIASICHGPQVLINAGLVKGRDITGVGDIRTDLRNAGGLVHEDRPVVIDGNLLTSRDPNDLAEFSMAIEAWLVKKAGFAALHDETGSTVASIAPDQQRYTTVCPVCKGSGTLHGGPGYYPYQCPTCHGTGTVNGNPNQPPVSTDH